MATTKELEYEVEVLKLETISGFQRSEKVIQELESAIKLYSSRGLVNPKEELIDWFLELRSILKG